VAIGFRLQAGGVPVYHISYHGKPIVLESRLGLEPEFTRRFQPIKTDVTHHTGSWTNAFGERRIVPDNYNELTVNLRRADGHAMRLIFRAYNEGAAFRYVFPGNADEKFHFTGEATEFCFPSNTYGYEEHGTEGKYQRVPVADIQPQCERPLTLEYADGFYAGLCEADNQNYPRLLLSPESNKPGALVSALGGTTANTTESRFRQRNDASAVLHGGDATPWRLFIVGQKPGDLLERNYLVLDLNPPCALAETSWIKPGKLMRDVTLTTTNARAIIDLAATAGLRYVLFDSGWYGPESAENSDPTTVARANLNLPEVIRYGKRKGVGVILYVNRRPAEKLRDVIFPLYEKWGVAGVKLGFVNVGPQTDTAWIAKTIQKAAEHHLLLNIHDGYRPTGLARTWPNLLTVEGVRGNEHFPTAEHNCTLPFTRYLAGFADYTVCYYSPRLKNTTHAHQLAMAVVSFSPLQSVFWYDKPSDYHGEPEIEFFQHVPTVWDDTKVLAGEIGQYAAIARRRGDEWFVGVINDDEPRALNLSLAFLDPGRKYTAHIYADDPSVPTRTHVAVTTRLVDGKTLLNVPLKPTGGEAIWLAPVSEQ
jgi:alpha-glucosidase